MLAGPPRPLSAFRLNLNPLVKITNPIVIPNLWGNIDL